MMKKWAAIIIMAITTLALLAFAGCGCNETPDNPTPEPGGKTEVEITLDKTSLELDLQQTGTITATTKHTLNGVTFTSSDPEIASVTAEGKTATVTAKKVGTAVVTAAVDGKNATATVTVVDRGSTAFIKLDNCNENANLNKGDTFTVEASVMFQGAKQETSITASSSDETVVSVDGLKLTAVAVGQATVTFKAEFANRKLETSVAINVLPLAFEITAGKGIECESIAYAGSEVVAEIVRIEGEKVTAVQVTGVENAEVDLENGTVKFVMPENDVTISTETSFFDWEKEENVLLDFNEKYYNNVISKGGTSSFGMYNIGDEYIPDHFSELEMDGAVFWQTFAQYDTIRFDFGQSVNVRDIGGIYFDMCYTYAEVDNLFVMFKDADGNTKYERNVLDFSKSPSDAWGDMNRYYIPAGAILNGGLEAIDHIIFETNTTSQNNHFITEVGVVPATDKAVNNKIVIDFNEYNEMLAYSDDGDISVIESGNAALPAGMSGGVLNVSKVGSGKHVYVNLNGIVMAEDIESIEFKIYIDQEADGAWLGTNLRSVSGGAQTLGLMKEYRWESNAVTETNTYTVTGAKILEYFEDKNLAVCSFTLDKMAEVTANSVYYIDSITINLKAK